MQNKKVRDNYALALEEMDSFIDAFIDDGDLGKKLVRALLEVIDLDRTIDDDAEFEKVVAEFDSIMES